MDSREVMSSIAGHNPMIYFFVYKKFKRISTHRIVISAKEMPIYLEPTKY